MLKTKVLCKLSIISPSVKNPFHDEDMKLRSFYWKPVVCACPLMHKLNRYSKLIHQNLFFVPSINRLSLFMYGVCLFIF